MIKSSTETLISAARTLANDIKTQDGVANEALREIADRLEEQADRIGKLNIFLKEVLIDSWSPDEDFDCTELSVRLGLTEKKERVGKPCGKNCTCKELGGKFPLDCFRIVNHDK